MYNSKIAKKGTFLFSAGILINLLISSILFAGAFLLSNKGTDNSKEIVELTKEKGLYVVEELYNTFSSASGDLRDDDPKIVAQQNLFDALNYDLTLSFNIQERTLSGDCYMKAVSKSDTLSTLYINLYDNMKANMVSYVTGPGGNDGLRNVTGLKEASFTQDKNYLIVTLSEQIKNGEDFVIKISYSGSPVKKGFDSFSFKELYNNMYIYTLSEPTWGPVWWPSKDLPNDKALTQVHLNVQTGMKGVSNGLLTDTVPNSDGTTTFNWKSSYPISTYLVSIVVGNLSYWEDTYRSLDGTKQMPVVYYVFPRDSAQSRVDFKEAPEMIKLFSETFGEYAFVDEKYGMAEFGWTSGAMEHQTITSYGYLLITGDHRFDYVSAHEVSHHWFGDAVTLKDWRNIWLNEGFASYCESLWEEHTGGMDAYLEHMKGFDFGFFSGTVYDPKGFIDNPAVYATVYQKGAWVLHMLRGVLGDELFFKAIRAYYEKYKYRNAETQDLQDVFEEIYGDKLDWFFDEWVYSGTGRPKYEYSWKFEDFQDQKGLAYTVRLNLKQVQNNDIDVYKMPVRITVVTAGGDKEFTVFNDKREQSILLTVDSTPKEVIIDKDGWILKKAAKGTYER